MAGMITALVVLGVVDLCVIADARAKRKRKIEDDLHRQVEEARAQRAPQCPPRNSRRYSRTSLVAAPEFAMIGLRTLAAVGRPFW
jgi:hypothetical protein